MHRKSLEAADKLKDYDEHEGEDDQERDSDVDDDDEASFTSSVDITSNQIMDNPSTMIESVKRNNEGKCNNNKKARKSPKKLNEQAGQQQQPQQLNFLGLYNSTKLCGGETQSPGPTHNSDNGSGNTNTHYSNELSKHYFKM